MDLMPVKQVGVCCLKIYYKFLLADNSREIAPLRLSQQLYIFKVGAGGGIFVVLTNTLNHGEVCRRYFLRDIKVFR
jgi:hypothetical protein